MNSPPESRRAPRLNARLIVALVFDLVAWALIIGAGWGALKLLKMV